MHLASSHNRQQSQNLKPTCFQTQSYCHFDSVYSNSPTWLSARVLVIDNEYKLFNSTSKFSSISINVIWCENVQADPKSINQTKPLEAGAKLVLVHQSPLQCLAGGSTGHPWGERSCLLTGRVLLAWCCCPWEDLCSSEYPWDWLHVLWVFFCLLLSVLFLP